MEKLWLALMLVWHQNSQPGHTAPLLLKVCREEKRIGLHSAPGWGVKTVFWGSSTRASTWKKKIIRSQRAAEGNSKQGKHLQNNQGSDGHQQVIQSHCWVRNSGGDARWRVVEKTGLKMSPGNRWGKATKMVLINIMLLILRNSWLF